MAKQTNHQFALSPSELFQDFLTDNQAEKHQICGTWRIITICTLEKLRKMMRREMFVSSKWWIFIKTY